MARKEGFVSKAQQAVVMAKLRKEGYPKPLKIRQTKRFYRARITEPSKLKKGSLRTLDVGKKGGIVLVIGRKKGSVKTSTQSVLVER